MIKQFYLTHVKTFLFQTIQFSQTVLIKTTQFSIRMQFSSFGLIDRTLSGATTPGQSGHGSDGNEGVLRIPLSSSITGASPSDCLASYQDTRWGRGVIPLQRGSRCILQSQLIRLDFVLLILELLNIEIYILGEYEYLIFYWISFFLSL